MSRFLTYLPDTVLVNENSEVTSFHTLIKDSTVVINMFYSNCEIKCQPLGRLMSRVNRLLSNHLESDRIRFVSITLDAENDDCAALKAFKNKVFHANCQNWHFYTGNYGDLEHLRRKLGMYSPEPEVDRIKSNHSGNFLIMSESVNVVKHTESFDNPIDIARKVLQAVPKNYLSHSYKLDGLKFEELTDEELFENIHSVNSIFTVAMLPAEIRNRYNKHAELQRGFQYDPLKINTVDKKGCCCRRAK